MLQNLLVILLFEDIDTPSRANYAMSFISTFYNDETGAKDNSPAGCQIAVADAEFAAGPSVATPKTSSRSWRICFGSPIGTSKGLRDIGLRCSSLDIS